MKNLNMKTLDRRMLLLFAGSVLCLSGCMRSSGPARCPFAGTVTVNGDPLPAGRIRFTPRIGTQGPAASAGIVNGLFRVPVEEGLLPGVYRVEIEAAENLGFSIDDEAAFAKRGGKPLPPNPIPGRYHCDSSLTAAITSISKNEFTFDLEVKDKKSKVKGS